MANYRSFQPVNVAQNYFAGRQFADDEALRGSRNALAQQDVELGQRFNALADNPNAGASDYARIGRSDVANSLTNQQRFSEEQQRQLAGVMVQAAQYGLQSPQPKAFIEQNYPQLAQLAGPEWQSLDDNGVKAKLQEAIGVFGPRAGVGPAGPKDVGPLEMYIGDDGDPVFGTRQEAIGRRPYDKPPQVVQQFTPVQTDVGVGAFNSRTGQVTPTGVKAPPKEKPPTESDKKVRVLFSSMANAEKQLAETKGEDTASIGQGILGSNPFTRAMQSDDFKKYEAAGLRWAANLLYLKSGATATPDEIRSTWKQFFPQPGDGDEVKTQKLTARQQEMDAVSDSYGMPRVVIEGVGKRQQAPPEAIEYLRQHPELKEQFRAKYGYLP